MENKLLLTFFILIQVVFLVYCDTESDSNPFDSFAPEPDENQDPGNINQSQNNDSDVAEPNQTAQIMPQRPIFNGFLEETDSKVFDNSQDLAGRSFTDRNNKMQEMYLKQAKQTPPEFPQEKKRYFNINNQNYQQGLSPFLYNQGNSQPRNQWGKVGYGKHQPGRDGRGYQKDIENFRGRAAASSSGKPKANSRDRDEGFVASSWGSWGMDQAFQQESLMPERKVSVTVLNEEVNAADNYKQALMNNFYKSQMNSNFNDFNRNPEKGIIINFNSDCPSSKTCPNPLYQKFVYPPKAQVPQTEVPTFRLPQMPRMSQMSQIRQMQQMPQISQLPQMPQMSQISQFQQLSQLPQMPEMPQISQINQMSPMSQVPQISEFSEIGETPIYTREITTPIYCM